MIDPSEVGHIDASWDIAGGTGAIVVSGPALDGSVRFEARAWFGGLEHRWEAGPYELGAECVSIELAIPAEAYLHALANEYVTDLLVQVFPEGKAGERYQEVGLPPAYAIWLDGPDAPPTVWDAAALAENAPMGALNPEEKADLTILPEGARVRLLPPIYRDVQLPRTENTDERTTTETVPVDDQSDEVAE